jgi:hypothetical protein
MRAQQAALAVTAVVRGGGREWGPPRSVEVAAAVWPPAMTPLLETARAWSRAQPTVGAARDISASAANALRPSAWPTVTAAPGRCV